MAGSAQTHKSISLIWIVWSTLYVYLWLKVWQHAWAYVKKERKKGETYMNNVDIVRVVLQNSIFILLPESWGAKENPCVQLSKFTQTKNAALNP